MTKPSVLIATAIMIATPSYDTRFNRIYVASLIETTFALSRAGEIAVDLIVGRDRRGSHRRRYHRRSAVPAVDQVVAERQASLGDCFGASPLV